MIIAIRGMQKQPPSLSRSRHNYIPWACARLRAQGHAVEVDAEAMAEIELRDCAGEMLERITLGELAMIIGAMGR